MKISEEKLNKAMQRKLMTIQDIAKETGLNPNTIGRARAGQVAPRMRTIKKICAALDCDPEDILTEE